MRRRHLVNCWIWAWLMTEIIQLYQGAPARNARFTVSAPTTFARRLLFALGVRLIRLGCLMAGLRFTAYQETRPERVTRAFADNGRQ